MRPVRAYRILFRNTVFYLVFPLALPRIDTLAGLAPFPVAKLAIPSAAIVALSMILEILTSRELLKSGAGGTSFSDPPRRLVTAGPYGLVRHPMYLGNMMGLSGLSILLGSPMFLAYSTVVVVGILLWSRKEEAALLLRYGDEYRLYARRTPPFIPRLGLASPRTR